MMKRTICLIILVCYPAVVLRASHPLSPSRTGEIALTDRTIEELKLSDVEMLEALGMLASDYGVPIGVELAADHRSAGVKININVRRAKLRDILDLIVRQDTRYRWEVNDNVINFAPTRLRDQFLQKLLSTNVSRFTHRKGANGDELKDAVTDSQEVQSLLKEGNIFPLNMSMMSNRTKLPQDLDLSMTNASVKEILNRIARESTFNFWIIDRVGDKRDALYITL